MMDENVETGEAPPDDGDSLDDLPVRVLFELGRARLSFAELTRVAPGYVFDLGHPVGDVVDIVVGGRRIGRGELVRIGRNVGVRVRKLFEH